MLRHRHTLGAVLDRALSEQEGHRAPHTRLHVTVGRAMETALYVTLGAGASLTLGMLNLGTSPIHHPPQSSTSLALSGHSRYGT